MHWIGQRPRQLDEIRIFHSVGFFFPSFLLSHRQVLTAKVEPTCSEPTLHGEQSVAFASLMAKTILIKWWAHTMMFKCFIKCIVYHYKKLKKCNSAAGSGMLAFLHALLSAPLKQLELEELNTLCCRAGSCPMYCRQFIGHNVVDIEKFQDIDWCLISMRICLWAIPFNHLRWGPWLRTPIFYLIIRIGSINCTTFHKLY